MSARLVVLLVAMVCATALAVTWLIVSQEDAAPGAPAPADSPGLPCERLESC